MLDRVGGHARGGLIVRGSHGALRRRRYPDGLAGEADPVRGAHHTAACDGVQGAMDDHAGPNREGR